MHYLVVQVQAEEFLLNITHEDVVLSERISEKLKLGIRVTGQLLGWRFRQQRGR